MVEKISKEKTFGEILKICPESSYILMNYGLHCIGCHIAIVETLEQGCRAHGLSEEQIEEIVDKINNLIKEKGEKNANED